MLYSTTIYVYHPSPKDLRQVAIEIEVAEEFGLKSAFYVLDGDDFCGKYLGESQEQEDAANAEVAKRGFWAMDGTYEFDPNVDLHVW